MSEPRLIIIDGYNLILRAPTLRPGPDRTLREAREKLANLLSWAFGPAGSRFVVVFDGDDQSGGDEQSGRVEIRYSRPPEKADDVIRRLVEKKVGGDERVTVVTADLEVARHARAMGADISLADLFLASTLGPQDPEASETPEKPVSLSKKEIEEWAEIFRMRPRDEPSDDPEPTKH